MSRYTVYVVPDAPRFPAVPGQARCSTARNDGKRLNMANPSRFEQWHTAQKRGSYFGLRCYRPNISPRPCTPGARARIVRSLTDVRL